MGFWVCVRGFRSSLARGEEGRCAGIATLYPESCVGRRPRAAAPFHRPPQLARQHRLCIPGDNWMPRVVRRRWRARPGWWSLSQWPGPVSLQCPLSPHCCRWVTRGGWRAPLSPGGPSLSPVAGSAFRGEEWGPRAASILRGLSAQPLGRWARSPLTVPLNPQGTGFGPFGHRAPAIGSPPCRRGAGQACGPGNGQWPSDPARGMPTGVCSLSEDRALSTHGAGSSVSPHHQPTSQRLKPGRGLPRVLTLQPAWHKLLFWR